jgi:trehalose-phosphatase
MPASALDHWGEIASRLHGRRPALFLDYDGTLSPIAPRPELAALPADMREVLRRLSVRFPVVVVSGRRREDASALVGLPDLVYAGSHGFDIAGPPPVAGAPPLRLEVGDGIPERIDRAAERLRRELAGIEGVLVEPKRFAISVHFRLADESEVPRIERAVDETLAAVPGLRKGHGRMLFELLPDIDWDKGRAVLWLLDALGLDRPEVLPFYVGDDLTDEDAFQAVAGRGIGIVVGEEPRETAAQYRLRDTEEVRELLEKLAAESAPPEPSYPTVEEGIPGSLARMQPGEINLLGPFAVPELAPRLIRVYLPRGYDPAEPRFGLYLFDGQNVFDDAGSFSGGWHVHAIVETLPKSHRPVPVVIGIDHAGVDRIRELLPFQIEEEPGKAEIFLAWITGRLMPALTAELNLIPGPLGAVIGGSSMGGLAALWSHFHYPQAFGGAIVMSPAFWVADQAIFADIAAQPTPEVSRLYLDGGVREAKSQVVEAVKTMAEQLTERGYDSDRLMWRADTRGTHSEASWRRRLPGALRFMYRRS